MVMLDDPTKIVDTLCGSCAGIKLLWSFSRLTTGRSITWAQRMSRVTGVGGEEIGGWCPQSFHHVLLHNARDDGRVAFFG